MNRRDFLRAMGAAAALTFPAGAGAQTKRDPLDKPNFIVIFTDDQGYADVGCFGAKGYETPCIDRMAEEGVRFTDFYAVAPSCSPSRAALMTGCYPQRVGIPHVLNPRSNTGISDDEVTLAELLKTRGYATACYGKWHLGHQKQFLPVHHGFDEYYGLPYSNDMWPNHPTADWYPDLPLMEGDEVAELDPDQSQLTTEYTRRAVDFIRRNQDRPFFLYLPHTMAHVPLFVSDKFRGKSEQGLYGDVCMELDWSVGEILKTVQECGIDDNTLVVYTSDNGPWLNYGGHAGSAEPLREGKGTTFEGGQREPCVMRWPGQIPAGTDCDEMAAVFDLYPTFAELADAELPGGRVIDGKNIWPLLTDPENAKTPHEAFYFLNGKSLQAVRSGDWKLHWPRKYRHVPEAGSGGIPGKQIQKRIGQALFNLDKDIDESDNVALEHPEIVAKLDGMMRAFEEELKANSRPPGRVPG